MNLSILFNKHLASLIGRGSLMNTLDQSECCFISARYLTHLPTRNSNGNRRVVLIEYSLLCSGYINDPECL